MRYSRSSWFTASLLLAGAFASGCGEEKPAANTPPTVSAPTPTPAEVTAGNPVSLGQDAADADGDALTYAWTQTPATPAGTFSSPSAANPTWTAPQVTADTSFQLTVTVTDGKGGSATGSTSVKVLPARANHAPVLGSGPSASATSTPEQQPVTLSVTATDADGDTLTYAWSQVSPTSPVGSFSDASAANPTWTAPDVSANGTYTLRVTVTDGHGGSVQGTVDIAVQKVNRAPTVAATITAPASLKAGDTATFKLDASDPDGDPLTYSWEQTSPATQGTWVGARTGASTQWFSPVVGSATSYTFSVTVSDGQAAPVTRTVTVPVSVPLYTDVQAVWDGACTGCHGTAGGLNLAAGSSYAALVNAATTATACSTLKRVEPGNPDNSSLVHKLEGTSCGTRMPRNNVTYFDANPGLLVRVRSWILAGAAND